MRSQPAEVTRGAEPAFAIGRLGNRLSAVDYQRVLSRRLAFRRQVDTLFTEIDLLAVPVLAVPVLAFPAPTK